MARLRRKSIEDIQDQVYRIGRYRNLSVEQWEKINDIADRYIRNIMGMKSFDNKVGRGNYEHLSPNGIVFERDNAEKRRYSQRTYMGLSKG